MKSRFSSVTRNIYWCITHACAIEINLPMCAILPHSLLVLLNSSSVKLSELKAVATINKVRFKCLLKGGKQKALWVKEQILITCIFSFLFFSQCFQSRFSSCCQNWELFCLGLSVNRWTLV